MLMTFQTEVILLNLMVVTISLGKIFSTNVIFSASVNEEMTGTRNC